MKGLIRNNFYSIGSSLPILIASELALLIVGIIILTVKGNQNEFLTIAISGGIIGSQLGGCGALCGTAIQKDALSQWSKFELTLPVSRATVIKSRYISFLLYCVIGLMMSLITVASIYLLELPVITERIGYSLVFGIVFALAIPTFMTPLILIFGADKNEILLFISIVLGLGLFWGSATLANVLFAGVSNLYFRSAYLIFSGILYVLSYLLSRYLYKRKELM
ncbi:MAG: ABC-2 transporter permease [Eubacteriales bacterium]